MYYYCSRAEYRVKQAALTRALQTLYAKQLIDAGGRFQATGLQVYSVRRAARLGLDAALPRDEAAMNTPRVPLRYPGGPPDPRYRPWTPRSVGEKPRIHRNIKSLRLTEAGLAVATQLTETLNRQEGLAI